MWSGAESLLDGRKPRSVSEDPCRGEGVGGGLGGGVGGGLGGGVGGGLGGGVGGVGPAGRRGGLGRSFAGVPAEVDWAPGVGFIFLGGDVAICRITNHNTITLTFEVVFTETSGAVTDMSFMSADPMPDI